VCGHKVQLHQLLLPLASLSPGSLPLRQVPSVTGQHNRWTTQQVVMASTLMRVSVQEKRRSITRLSCGPGHNHPAQPQPWQQWAAMQVVPLLGLQASQAAQTRRLTKALQGLVHMVQTQHPLHHPPHQLFPYSSSHCSKNRRRSYLDCCR
jgi:hypothetical protein